MSNNNNKFVNWLEANDVNNDSAVRQYGIAAMIDGSPSVDAFTGNRTNDYKGHILGPNYAIQGNILLGPQILDSMEARFLRAEGDLSCRLLSALEGANVVGADSRCTPNGTSSLFAFIKVAEPTDAMGSPSFVASVRTRNNDRIEPIDSLRTLVSNMANCNLSRIAETSDFKNYFSVFPNPASETLNINVFESGEYDMKLITNSGKTIIVDKISANKSIDISTLSTGVYFLELSSSARSFTQKIIIK